MVSVCVWRKREVKSVKVTGLEWKIDCSSRIGAGPQSAQGLVWSQVSFSALCATTPAFSYIPILDLNSYLVFNDHVQHNDSLGKCTIFWLKSLPRVQLGSLRIPVPYETSKHKCHNENGWIYVQRQTLVRYNLFFWKISSWDGSFYKNVCSPFGRFLHLELSLT